MKTSHCTRRKLGPLKKGATFSGRRLPKEMSYLSVLSGSDTVVCDFNIVHDFFLETSVLNNKFISLFVLLLPSYQNKKLKTNQNQNTEINNSFEIILIRNI